MDHRERQIAPHSLAFNLPADKYCPPLPSGGHILHALIRLYCGFEDAIEVFNVQRPGEGTRLPTTPTKNSKDGLKGMYPFVFFFCFVIFESQASPSSSKGIISALSFSPSYDFYAAGSLVTSAPNIVIFSESEGEKPLMFVGTGEQGGVMQVRPAS